MIAAHIGPHHTDATIHLDAGPNYSTTRVTAIDYGSVAPPRNLGFQLNGNTVTSDPIIVCNDGSTNMLTFTNISIGNKVKYLELDDVYLAPGRRYSLTMNVTEFGQPDGIVNPSTPGMLWAPGNLIYIGTFPDGSYGFAENQGVTAGTIIWAWNSLTPNTPSYKTWAGDNPGGLLGDPCAQIFGGWRTPTPEEANMLLISNTSNRVWGSYNGVDGYYIGTSTVPPAAQRDEYLFLPVTPATNNDYLSLDPNTNSVGGIAPNESNFLSIAFNAGNMWYGSQYKGATGWPVRCLRNIP